ncbi:MAG: signal peptidase I [Rhodospirillaceae bacterium]|nr:signal peptidase I [Rhodospirillaceae bacterium]
MATKKSSGIGETIKTIFYAVLIALGVRTFLYEPFNIPSGSMIPTLLEGDYLFVSKFSYGYSRFTIPFGFHLFDGRILGGEPERGDVVVFKLPTDPSTDYIKRLIGLPGDRIQMIEGILHINGEAVPRRRVEDYVTTDRFGRTVRTTQYIETLPEGREHFIIERSDDGFLDNTQEYVVPEGHYFFMGDNRDSSQDSRVLGVVGYVPAENLVGRAEFLWFSLEPDASFWQIWRWPGSLRFERLFEGVN